MKPSEKHTRAAGAMQLRSFRQRRLILPERDKVRLFLKR